MLASARAALQRTNSSSWRGTSPALVPRAGAVQPVTRRSALTHLLVRCLAAVARATGEDHADQHGERHQVDQLDEPVAGVGEDEHRRYPFSAAESSHSPRQVKQTISTSMTICERAAAFGEP